MDILTQGQYPSALYILVSGKLEIVKNGKKLLQLEINRGLLPRRCCNIKRNIFRCSSCYPPSTLIEIKIRKEKIISEAYLPEIAISMAIKLAERTLAINELF